MVLEKKKERLEREKGEIRSARRAIVHTLYQEYQKTLIPSQWKYLPPTVDICAMDPLAAVLDAELDVAVTAADFEDAFRQLPGLISADFDARKLHARSLLKTLANQPACGAPGQGEITDGEASSSSNSLPPDALDLSTAVFRCHEASCRESYLFGWDDIAQHHCKPDLDLRSYSSWMPWIQTRHVEYKPGLPKMGFHALGSEIAAAVVRAAGLNDNVATASDMDAKTKDIRFGCFICPPAKINGTWKMSGYKWREMVRPAFEYIFSTVIRLISFRYPIVLSCCIHPRTPSPFSLQMSSQRSKKAKCLIHIVRLGEVNGRVGSARFTSAT
jgi:hypothetical protein